MSEKPLIIHRGRTNVVLLGIGVDVSGDTITSQIRTKRDVNSPLLAEWEVTPVTDGTDGELRLTLSAEKTNVSNTNGYMDLKRVSSGQPLSVFAEPLRVSFQGVVTE